MQTEEMVFRRQLTYKAKELRLVGRFAQSTKTCSSCGHVKHDVTLKDRIYVCPDCGLEIDGDLNTAINISPVDYTGSGRGQESAGKDYR
ncbi:MAG: transposase [Treponema sp.]|jgi:transposase|nr:transposase [Treponema sp.]